MASGLLQLADRSDTTFDLLSATIADGLTAGTIILAMSFCLVVPKLAIDRICEQMIRKSSLPENLTYVSMVLTPDKR